MPTAATAELLAPSDFLQLTGHPVRWRLLTALGASDLRVHELTRIVGEPQNLVSYHLRKLRDGGVVRARRSSADGRDAYYALDLGRVRDHLGATGVALHAGLRLAPEPVGRAAGFAERRVLFLCTGNSARSQMAEALLAERSGGRIEVRSAGSDPKPLHPSAVRVMRDQHGIDISGRRSKHLAELAGERFDRVVTLCDRVREVCPEHPGAAVTSHWSIADPAASGSDDGDVPFQRTAAELDERIGYLLAALATTGGPDPNPQEELR